MKDEITELKDIIKEFYEVAYLGFYGTNENAARKTKIVTDPRVLKIVEEKI